jgi:alpha-glucoside transport system permease protein
MTATGENIRSILTKDPAPEGPAVEPVGQRTHRLIASLPTWVLWVLVLVWTVPSFGLLVNSLRPERDQLTEGWWKVFTNPDLTLDNYDRVLFDPPGGQVSFGRALLNSLAIAVPATIVPILLAAAAAYAFAWIPFKGRSWVFIGVIGLIAIPLQMTFVPLLQLYTGGAHVTVFGETLTLFPDLDLAGKASSVWLAHTAYGLPIAIFLLHNYIASLPPDLFEAATVDGADHFGIFWRIVLPLSRPALAAFAIFQFLWVWNDYLVALIFVSQNPDTSPLTVQLVNLVTARGQGTELLPAAAFVSIIVPLILFFALQKYFVRGLLAGSVKG